MMAEDSRKAREIDLGDDFGDVIVKANGAQVEISADGSFHGLPAPANDTVAKAEAAPQLSPEEAAALDFLRKVPTAKVQTTHEIGAIESAGDHKGEIYGGIFPDGKPGWILEEPEPLTHYDACELKGRALPTDKEGKYIDTIKDKRALKDIFARHSDSSSFTGYFWLAERNGDDARYQQFSDGSQYYYDFSTFTRLPVLSVRR